MWGQICFGSVISKSYSFYSTKKVWQWRKVNPKTVITFNNCMRSTDNIKLVPKHNMTSLSESPCSIILHVFKWFRFWAIPYVTVINDLWNSTTVARCQLYNYRSLVIRPNRRQSNPIIRIKLSVICINQNFYTRNKLKQMNDASFSQIINKSPSNRNKDGAIDIAVYNVSPDI